MTSEHNQETNVSDDAAQHSESPPRDGKIPITVWQIGFMMMLMNMSYVMIYSISSLYLKNVIGIGFLGIGIIEGLCETISHLMKLVSGVVSDIFKKRKNLIVIGYIFSAISKPLLAISSGVGLVFSARMMERFGNGVQASPRDAIIADIAPRKKIGASYGLKRTLAYSGSLLGGVIGVIAMTVTDSNYQMVFALATIPSVMALVILIVWVKEPARYKHQAVASATPMPAPKVTKSFSFKNFKYLGRGFWLLMAVNFVFMIARMNESFLVLRANTGFGMDPRFAPAIMILMNAGTSIASYPIGKMGDKFNRSKMLLIGISFLVLADIVMFAASAPIMMYLGVVLWGVQLGATQNVFVSMIAERVPEDLRGTGFGVYWLINAVAAFFADSIAGSIADVYDLSYTFLSSGIIGVISLAILTKMLVRNKPQSGALSE